ncbi:hypothetical protein [Roseimaritima sediminicola]|uniref:hypothetical protein n=1 Tax=Roseimaritima sediminicola TaxID=2662066 RepID=UPI0012982735|nr:hypothetical protein [Roseimaritima sediminicola]
MSLLQPCLRWSYRAIRRAAVLDVKRLLVAETAGLAPQNPPPGYQLKPLGPDQRSALGLPRGIVAADSAQHCLAAFYRDRVASYVFLARGHVPAAFHFSRAPHLGTDLKLPAGGVFVHTAFTVPEHRGRRLPAALLSAALGLARKLDPDASCDSDGSGSSDGSGLLDASGVLAFDGPVTHAFTSMDWTNEPSRRAFTHLGFRPLGLIYRLGWSCVQATLYPRAAGRMGIRVSERNQGIRVALG